MTAFGSLVELLDEMGRRPSPEGGGLSELDHMLQCAFELSVDRPDDPELQVAGLVHDVGHEVGSDADHGSLGAAFVRPVLGDRVADLVDAHVPAKRYLVATDAGYRERLSADSIRTLAVQGEELPSEEIEAFRRSSVFEDALVLRRADEAAKVPRRVVPGLDHWVDALRAASFRAAGG